MNASGTQFWWGGEHSIHFKTPVVLRQIDIWSYNSIYSTGTYEFEGIAAQYITGCNDSIYVRSRANDQTDSTSTTWTALSGIAVRIATTDNCLWSPARPHRGCSTLLTKIYRIQLRHKLVE